MRLHRPTYSICSYIDYIYSVHTYLDPLKLMHLCNIPNVYIILQKNKKYTVSTLLTALKNFVTDLVPSEVVCFNNSGKRAGYHTHILIIFGDIHSKEPIHVTSQSHMKLFWLVDHFFATQLDTSYPHHTQVTLFLHHHVMCHISKLTNLLLLPLQLVSQHLQCVMFPSSPTCFPRENHGLCNPHGSWVQVVQVWVQVGNSHPSETLTCGLGWHRLVWVFFF